MMNKSFMQIGAMIAGGKTPQQLLQMMVQNNPQAKQAMQMIQGKTPAELEQIARNMAKERGTTIEDITRSMGIKF